MCKHRVSALLYEVLLFPMNVSCSLKIEPCCIVLVGNVALVAKLLSGDSDWLRECCSADFESRCEKELDATLGKVLIAVNFWGKS